MFYVSLENKKGGGPPCLMGVGSRINLGCKYFDQCYGKKNIER